jgi:hypothetical protein
MIGISHSTLPIQLGRAMATTCLLELVYLLGSPQLEFLAIQNTNVVGDAPTVLLHTSTVIF